MRPTLHSTVLLTLLSLSALRTVVAHGDEVAATHAAMDMSAATSVHDGHPFMQMANPEDPSYGTDPSYWRTSEHSGLMYAHILLMVANWVVVMPIAVMLSIARSHFTAPAQIIFLILNGLGLMTSIIYNHMVPALYENNSHHKAGWAVSCIAMLWIIISLVWTYAGRGGKAVDRRPSIQPVTQQAIADHQRLHNLHEIEDFRWSHDSGHGTKRNAESISSGSRTASVNSSDSQVFLTCKIFSNHNEDDFEDEALDSEKAGFLQDAPTEGPSNRIVSRVSKGLVVFKVIYTILERFMIMLGFIALITGIVVYAGIFQGSNIFNGLAHFVKGGIFFWYGLLTFGRWMGCFADFGWAWNIKPETEVVGKRKALVPSAEFTESFVIFLYGASNVFLEHLAAWGETWTPMDLEHVSISIMFFGGGLLGMLIESPRVRKFLNGTVTGLETSNSTLQNAEKWQTPKSYVHSLNPLPALIIMLLGIMMSSHTQHSGISVAIHKQWGNMFVFFAIARAVTYITFWLKPPKSYMPSRPPSEIIASFCLVSGGIIFMASNRDTVTALEHYQLDAMFTFTVTMGFVCLLMAWVVVVVAVKGWATRREQSLRRDPISTSAA